jgi:putative nucleotidyltransferase with HDIG domain
VGLLRFLNSWLGKPVQPGPPESAPFQSATAVLEAPAPEPALDEAPRAGAPPSAAGNATPADPDAWWDRLPPQVPAPTIERAGAIDCELHDQLVRRLDDPTLDLPPLPQIAQGVLLALRDDAVDLRRAAELAAQDPTLTTAVLRLVNSVAYRGVREIRRVDQAFVRVGQKAARTVVLASIVRELTTKLAGSCRAIGDQLWRGAVASGTIAAHFAPRARVNSDLAFLAGLLHDIGKLAILKILHDHAKSRRAAIGSDEFEELCLRWHEHLGLRLAEAWNLPDPLPEIIAAHHREPAYDDPLAPLRLLVALSDLCCSRLGLGPPVPGEFFAHYCVRGLDLADNPPTCAMLKQVPKLLEQCTGAFL